jgi:hypothetical protein
MCRCIVWVKAGGRDFTGDAIVEDFCHIIDECVTLINMHYIFLSKFIRWLVFHRDTSASI